MKKNALLILALITVAALIIALEPKRGTNQERVEPLTQKAGTISPELTGISHYLNTENITIGELVGKKIILVDIWTYSCINCQRTLPYITAWHEKYKDQGLEIIGVHSPEFEFEKKLENVKRAIEKFGIRYPVVLDNDHETWTAFRNSYWPRKYLIDIDGYIAYDHIGEGGYEETENRIRELLKERAERLGLAKEMPGMANITPIPLDFGRINTPEIYLGYEFTRGNFGNPEGLSAETQRDYSLPKRFLPNNVYLAGTWYSNDDHVRLVSDNGRIVLPYDAKTVNIVASGPANVEVFVDDEKLSDVKITEEDLYTVVDGDSYGKHKVELRVSGSGFKLYTFTFG